LIILILFGKTAILYSQAIQIFTHAMRQYISALVFRINLLRCRADLGLADVSLNDSLELDFLKVFLFPSTARFT